MRRHFYKPPSAGDVRSCGAADGIAVIALEEAVKARVLFVPLLGDRFGLQLGIGDDQLRLLLHGPHAHFFRHAMAAWQVLSKRSREPSRIVEAIHSAPLTTEEFDAIDRFMMASHRKERGFYVDFTETGWSTPASITEDHWLASRAFAEAFVAETTEQASQARAILDSLTRIAAACSCWVAVVCAYIEFPQFVAWGCPALRGASWPFTLVTWTSTEYKG